MVSKMEVRGKKSRQTQSTKEHANAVAADDLSLDQGALRPMIWSTSLIFLTLVFLTALMLLAVKNLTTGGGGHSIEISTDIHATR